jgi:hypothetical protein
VPLSITFGSDAKILSSEVIASSPSDLSPSISATTQGITLAPLLLNPNDYFMIKALVSERQGSISVTARIIGVERVVCIKESLIKRGAPWFVFGSLGLCVGIILNWILSFVKLADFLSYAAIVAAVFAVAISFARYHQRQGKKAQTGGTKL